MLNKENKVSHENRSLQDFGLTVNSVGLKSLSKQDLDSSETNSANRQYQFKQGKINEEYKLIYILNGIGFVQFGEEDVIEISKGDMLIIRPNQVYKYCYLPESDWKEYHIYFEYNSIYHHLVNQIFNDQNQVLNIRFNEELIQLFQRALEVVGQGLKSSEVYISGILMHILGLLITEMNNKDKHESYNEEIEQAKFIMHEKVNENIDLDEIASTLNQSYSTFRRNFKKYVGTSPAKFYSNLKIEKAKQLMRETTQSIKEIAYSLQYNTVEHFFTIFKKETGITPGEYRSSISNFKEQ